MADKKEITFSQAVHDWMIKNGIPREKAEAALERARRRKKLAEEERRFPIELESDRPDRH